MSCVYRLIKILKKISDLKCCDIYWEFISRVSKPPSAVSKWEEKYDLINFNWQDIFSIPFKTARELSIHSLQFQIVNRFFPCNEILHTWYPKQSNKCSYCDCFESIEHYFFECPNLKTFWNQFLGWFSHTLKIEVKIGSLDVIFGIVNNNDLVAIQVLNFCILFAKFFIYKRKSSSADIDFYTYQVELKHRLEIEHMICMQQGRLNLYYNVWESVENNL